MEVYGCVPHLTTCTSNATVISPMILLVAYFRCQLLLFLLVLYVDFALKWNVSANYGPAVRFSNCSSSCFYNGFRIPKSLLSVY